jgi:hypothetical protein
MRYIEVYTLIYLVVQFEGYLYDAMVQVGPKSYIQVYTGMYFSPQVYTSIYLDVQTEESIYLDVRNRVFIYHTRYIRVHRSIGFLFPAAAAPRAGGLA